MIRTATVRHLQSAYTPTPCSHYTRQETGVPDWYAGLHNLRSGQRLVLTGAERALGEWHPEQGLPMAEHNYCEWVAEIPIDLLTQTTIEFKFVIIHDGADPSPIWEDGMNRTTTLADEPGLQVYEFGPVFLPAVR